MNWLSVVCFSWKKCYMSLKNKRSTRVEATFKEKNATSLKIYKFRGVCKIGTCSHDRCGDPQPRCKAIPKTILQRWKIGPLNKGSNIFSMMWCDRIFNWLEGSNFFWPGLNFCNIKNHQKTSESINLLDLPTALLNLYIFRFRKQEKNWLKSFIFRATLVRIT